MSGDRPDDPREVVVWRIGDALLAAAIEDVAEIASVDREGKARSRYGALPLAAPRGLPASGRTRRAVVLRTSRGPVAAAADDVDGVHACEAGTIGPPPAWLEGLDAAGVRALIRLGDQRIAALLEPDSLAPGP